MKKLFRKKLRKSKSVQAEARVNGGDTVLSNPGPDVVRPIDNFQHLDESAFATSSGDEHRFDTQLDKHMMQTINDVKFVSRPKFTEIGDVNFQRECLDAHNALRHSYGCPLLVWCQELAELAHTWALKLAHRGRILYPELPDPLAYLTYPCEHLEGIGENIRLSVADEQTHLPSGQEIVHIWGAESDQFNFEAPKWSPVSQHFTQMVWRSTYEMGIARHWNTQKNCVAIVAFYRAPGNTNGPGEFRANLPNSRPLQTCRSPMITQQHHNDNHSSPPLRRMMKALKRSVTINDP